VTGTADPPSALAVRDNAAWCDLVCSLHGLPTTTTDRAWWTGRRSPDGYPDAISLVPGIADEELVRLLGAIEPGPGASIKDSFADLPLARHGFEILFEATWIQRPPGSRAATPADGLRWSRLTTAEALVPWAALHGGAALADPRLLDQPEIAILAAHDGARLVGGAIATLGHEAAGISNVIASDGDGSSLFARAADAIATLVPDRPIVGYEHGPTLAAAIAAGFSPTGSLRVWLHP